MLRQPGGGRRPGPAAPGAEGRRGASASALGDTRKVWYLRGTPQTPATPGRSGRNSTGFSRPNTNSRHRLGSKAVAVPLGRRARCVPLQAGAAPAPRSPSREGPSGSPRPSLRAGAAPSPARPGRPPPCPRTTCPGGRSSWSAWCCGRCRRLCRRNPSLPPSHRVKEAAHSPLF